VRIPCRQQETLARAKGGKMADATPYVLQILARAEIGLPGKMAIGIVPGPRAQSPRSRLGPGWRPATLTIRIRTRPTLT
jgi:hypothetical protein